MPIAPPKRLFPSKVLLSTPISEDPEISNTTVPPANEELPPEVPEEAGDE